MARDLVMDAVVRQDSKALTVVANELDHTAGKVEKLDTRMHSAGKTSAELDKRILALRKSTADLGAEFLRTGDKTIFGDIRKNQTSIRQLEQIKANMEAIARLGEKSAEGAASTPGVGPIAIGAGVAVAIAVAPAIGAAIAGAVTGAVGAGGIIGGLVSASRDSRVQAEARAVGDRLSREFFGNSAFVGPAIDALRTLDSAVGGIDISGKLGKLAPFVGDLAEGLGKAATAFSAGFGQALVNAGPAVEVLAEKLPELGDALGDALNTVTKGDGALEGLAFTLDVVSGAIRTTANVVGHLSNAFDRGIRFYAAAGEKLGSLSRIGSFGANNPVSAWVGAWSDKFKEWIGVADQGKEAADRARGGFHRLAPTIDTTADAVSRANDAFSKFYGITFGLEESQDRAADAVQRLNDQIQQQIKDGVAGAGSFEGNTEAARKNRDAARDIVQAYGDMAVNVAKAGGSVDVLRAQLVEQLVQLGLSRAEAERYAQVLGNVKAALDAIQSKTVYVDIVTRGNTAGVGFLEGNEPTGKPRAMGGTAYAGEIYQVNEQGTGRQVELFRPAVTGQVIPLTGSGAQAAGGAGGNADMARMVAMAVANALAGLAVVLDGQAVGSIQARTAQRYMRGG